MERPLAERAAKKSRVPRRADDVKGVPVRRSQEERSAETRRRLIDAAITVLREEGYANLTISKVTQSAGMTNGAMQHHFTSREDLMLALLDRVYPILQIPFDAIAAEKLEPRLRISRLIDVFWSIYSRPEYLVVWDIALGSRGDTRLWPRVRSYQREISRHVSSEFVRLFAEFNLSANEAERIMAIPIGCIRGVAFLEMFGKDHMEFIDFHVIKDLAYRALLASAKAKA